MIVPAENKPEAPRKKKVNYLIMGVFLALIIIILILLIVVVVILTNQTGKS